MKLVFSWFCLFPGDLIFPCQALYVTVIVNFCNDRLPLQVKMSVFLTYMHAVGIKASILIIFFYLLSNVAAMISNFWLSSWSMDCTTVFGNNSGNATGNDSLSQNLDTVTLRLGVYGTLGLLQGNFIHTSFDNSIYLNTSRFTI